MDFTGHPGAGHRAFTARPDREAMRVAIVSESFFPQVNGVTNTVRHTVDRLLETGHKPLVVAPGPGLTCYRTAPVVRVRSMALPGYRSFPLGLPDAAVERTLREFGPDVVHLASPIALGAVGLRAARRPQQGEPHPPEPLVPAERYGSFGQASRGNRR